MYTEIDAQCIEMETERYRCRGDGDTDYRGDVAWVSLQGHTDNTGLGCVDRVRCVMDKYRCMMYRDGDRDTGVGVMAVQTYRGDVVWVPAQVHMN